ncbi:hypothetical protein M408DRAFT_110067 [Serendipita vermifera MAFF 305830]|uniref:Uncharacterized protein n=1 Tax=Serendipita vermifera MAFF 305830 TaxID=933852 RepID=A0A0C3AML7_SERVB|nr:hypothetical protein M408DRAFT_110067 [Serendipita vermifera MAFF 305830]
MSLLQSLGLRRSPRNHRAGARTTTRKHNTLTGPGGLFHHKKRANRNAGYKASLTNPNSTKAGRAHAKHELHMRGQSAHVPLTKKIERTLGMHQTSRSTRKKAAARRRGY